MEPVNGGARPPGGQAGLTGNLTQLSSAVAKMLEMQTSSAKMYFDLPFFCLSTVQENNGGKAE